MPRISPLPASVPECHKKEGICYAFAPNGLELPVIDVGHPAFAVDPAEVEALLAEASARPRSGAAMPAFIRAILARVMPRFSILAREIAASRGGHLSGLGTYLIKLGPDMLGSGFASSLDRKIAGTVIGLGARQRLRATASLLAERLAPRLEAEPRRPLVLLDIAGGPSADCLNALLMLARRGLLAHRAVSLHVLDLDAEGPSFGRACLEALRAPGAPLAGLDIAMTIRSYDWNGTSALRELVRASREAILAAASEGGLFEYGSDEAIAANLEALAEAGGPVVGSLSGTGGVPGSLNAASGAAIRQWGEGYGLFEGLAARSGWRVAGKADTPLGRVVALERG